MEIDWTYQRRSRESRSRSRDHDKISLHIKLTNLPNDCSDAKILKIFKTIASKGLKVVSKDQNSCVVECASQHLVQQCLAFDMSYLCQC